MNKRYKEAANLIEATDELLSYFEDYVNTTPEISQIKQERDRLCKELRLQILEDFNNIEKGSTKEKLYEACFALDAIGEQAVNDLRGWFCTYLLEPYQELFCASKPEGSFQNTKRRFAWFKRTLKDSDHLFKIFPEEWQMVHMQAYEFCRVTKLHLDEIMSTSYTDIDVSDIISTM